MKKAEIADHILTKLENEKSSIRHSYLNTKDTIGFFFVDDFLPEEIALAIYQEFPQADAMKLNKSLREDKYIAAQMDKYDPILEEVLFAFQDQRIVDFIRMIKIEINGEF